MKPSPPESLRLLGELSDLHWSFEREMPGGQLSGNPGCIQLSNQRLDGGYRGGGYTELPEPETQPDWKCFRIGGNLAADRNFDPPFLRFVDDLFTNSENRRMKRIGESG